MTDEIVNAKGHTLEVKSSFVNPSNVNDKSPTLEVEISVVNPHFEHPEAYGLHEPRPHPETLTR